MNSISQYAMINPRLRQVAWGFCGHSDEGNPQISRMSTDDVNKYEYYVDEGFENKGCMAPDIEDELPDYMVMEGWEFI